MMQKVILAFLGLIFITDYTYQIQAQEIKKITDFGLIDNNATNETKALYYNLKEISKKQIMYGHQDDMAYGVGWWNIEGRSDVKEVCESYPAVFGWELGNLGQERSLDSVLFTDIQKWIIKAYNMGAVNTISWHMENPVTGKNGWDQTPAVKNILPGGDKHKYYKEQLKTFAQFNSALVNANGVQIPIAFRPFHEHNGSWFWWGKKECTVDEYKALWKFTVQYLRDSLNIHNLIYIYSPDGQFNDYLERYPGNEFVDILGVDYYFSGKLNEKSIHQFINTLTELTTSAKSRNKIAVLSETGYESIKDSLWHTKAILNPIKKNKSKIQLAYMLTWRNANVKHHFAPYPAHASASDFKKFYKDPYTLFANDLKKFSLYNFKK